MTSFRMLPLLRIAVSMVCGILCLLMIALWVRSYSYWDYTANGSLFSAAGRILVQKQIQARPENDTRSVMDYYTTRFGTSGYRVRGVNVIASGNGAEVPYWVLDLLLVGVIGVQWFRWRFSLHTLLLAVTLVAVVLGLVVTVN
jgi:hypothetical protein